MICHNKGTTPETTNETGFTARPGGFRFLVSPHQPFAAFEYEGSHFMYWTSTATAENKTWFRALYNYTNEVIIGFQGDPQRVAGHSVRCVKN